MTAQQAAVRSFYLPEVILYHDEEEAQEVPCLWGCDVPVCTGNPLSLGEAAAMADAMGMTYGQYSLLLSKQKRNVAIK